MKGRNARRAESSFVFECLGDDLVGFLHHGDLRCDIGVLTIVAGGPQYRGGVGRQLVALGRKLASQGYWVMRFDHRGIGDSEGEFRGFRALDDDIAAAIREFKARTPGIRGVILWGGCDSATAALLNAWKLPDVVGVIAGNPFVSTPASAKQAARVHYITRLRQASFWKKLARGEYRIGDYASALLAKLARGSGRTTGGDGRAAADNGFLGALLDGMSRFQGKVLFLMGDRFLLSNEFDVLVNSSARWRAAYGKAGHQRMDIKDGDQVFSSSAAQERLFEAASAWLQAEFPASLPARSRSRRPQLRQPADVAQ